jgi:hypothetical protein
VDEQAIINETRQWILSMVIGLNLCPFAARVYYANKIRYAVTHAQEEGALLGELASQLRSLASCPMSEVETALLICPRASDDFLEYNEFLTAAERLVFDLGLCGTIQLASFHPHYQFAGTDPQAVENYTNRSPYPMLHLLREDSVTAVASDLAEMRAIPRRNIANLRALGRKEILRMLKANESGLA